MTYEVREKMKGDEESGLDAKGNGRGGRGEGGGERKMRRVVGKEWLAIVNFIDRQINENN